MNKKALKKSKKVLKQKIKNSVHEIVVKVQGEPAKFLKESDLIPTPEGGKYMIPKTWLSEKQVLKVLQKTPPAHVYERPGKGGGKFYYVTGIYVTKILNYVFGWNWDFEIISHGKEGGQVWVHGKLTVKDDKGHVIVKSQFGRADIKIKKEDKSMLDFGNDLKAASTDALKKCASLLGIASDVYGKSEYKDIGYDVQPDKNGKTLPPPKKNETVVVPDNDHEIIDYVCADGGEDITKQEGEFSKKMFGRMLCRNHQKEAKENKK